jgi:glycosyltransferase involved in cell wall biosynthesis
VVHLITKLELGGAQENTLHTVAHLDRSRFSPWLLAGPGGLLDEEARGIPGVPFVTIPHLIREPRPGHDRRAFGEIRRLLARIRREAGDAPLIVHTHSSKAGILGRWAARAAGAEIIVHSIHGFGFTPAQSPPVRLAYLLLERITAPLTTHFIAVSGSNLEEGVRRRLFPRERVSLIRSGMVLEDYRRSPRPREEVRRSLGIPAGAPLVGMVACFKPQKAPLDFVRMAALVAARHPEARFVVAGDGELRGEMEAAREREGLGERLLLPGWRRDVPDLLHAMDLLVLTSRWEGLPRVVPQAMAAGLPVVATAVDGTPEAVTEGVTGFLAPPGDVALLARRVSLLLENPARAAAMGAEGARRVAEWDAAAMVRSQEELYLTLLGRLR